jgi:hypothetical protein
LDDVVNRRVREARILKRAREIARTGRHIGWYYVEAELRFQMGEPLAREVLANQQIRDELDRICTEARKLKKGAQAGGPSTTATLHSKRQLNADQKRALKAADIALFVKESGRKAQKGMNPNDRCYDREVEQVVNQMAPEMFDQLLRDSEA